MRNLYPSFENNRWLIREELLGGDTEVIAELYELENRPDEQKLATLFASSPRLLEALENVLGANWDSKWLKTARDAVTEAKK